MSRVTLLTSDTASGDAARALASPVGHLGVFRALAHATTSVVPVMRLGRTILSEQKLDHRRRELLILLAMKLEGGAYEWAQHIDVARRVGVTPAEIAAIEALRLDDPLFTTADQSLLAFGREVVEHVRVPAPVFDAVRAHFSETEIVEAIVAIGFYSNFN